MIMTMMMVVMVVVVVVMMIDDDDDDGGGDDDDDDDDDGRGGGDDGGGGDDDDDDCGGGGGNDDGDDDDVRRSDVSSLRTGVFEHEPDGRRTLLLRKAEQETAGDGSEQEGTTGSGRLSRLTSVIRSDDRAAGISAGLVDLSHKFKPARSR